MVAGFNSTASGAQAERDELLYIEDAQDINAKKLSPKTSLVQAKAHAHELKLWGRVVEGTVADNLNDAYLLPIKLHDKDKPDEVLDDTIYLEGSNVLWLGLSTACFGWIVKVHVPKDEAADTPVKDKKKRKMTAKKEVVALTHEVIYNTSATEIVVNGIVYVVQVRLI